MADAMLKRIYQSTLEFLQPVNLEERYKIAVDEAVKVMGADYGSIFLADKDGELVRAYSNVPQYRRAAPRKKGFAHKALINSRLYVVPAHVLKKVHKKELYDKGVRSLILIPLSFNNKTVGVLSLQTHSDKKVSVVSKSTINLFGSLISLGIRNSQLYEQMKDAVEARDLFISLASHELKTPLTTIAAYSDQIARRVGSREMPTEKSVEVLNAEVRRLKHLLNELLEIDQIKTGQLVYHLQSVNIKQIIKRAIVNFRFSYPGYKIFVESNIDSKNSVIQGDAEKLQQVLTNLFNNAAKFSSRVTPIIVSLKKEDGYIFIAISDYGKGIRKHEQNQVFTEFFKSNDHRKDGMGLGLYLVKSIVEKHHGTVTLESKLHKGTTVTLKLPQQLYES